MKILSNENIIKCDSKYMEIEIENALSFLLIDNIIKVSVITSNKGPVEDDMGLAIKFHDEVYVLMSEHPLYNNFLFEELGKVIELDFQAITDAASSCDNAEFIVYEK